MAKLKFDGKLVAEVVKASKKNVRLVHDEGVYLLPDEGTRPIVYAKGCDPKKDVDYYDKARDLVGGDDFVEYLPVGDFGDAGAITACEINITETQLKLMVAHQVKKQA